MTDKQTSLPLCPQPCVAEPIKEDAWEESREPSSDVILVPPPPPPPPPPGPSGLLVCYNGDSGGFVRIQTAPCNPADCGGGDAA